MIKVAWWCLYDGIRKIFTMVSESGTLSVSQWTEFSVVWFFCVCIWFIGFFLVFLCVQFSFSFLLFTFKRNGMYFIAIFKMVLQRKKMVLSMCLFWFFFFLLICLRSSIRMNLFHFSTRCNSLFGLMSLKYSHGFIDFVLQWIAVLKHVQ